MKMRKLRGEGELPRQQLGTEHGRTVTPGLVDWTFGREEPGPPSACGLGRLPALRAAHFLLPRSGILRRDAGPDPAAVGTPVQHGLFST